jgi:protein-S-isoprenylcysteine O-methyltransferase Ste14
MVRLGNFFFHYRNGLFPVIYLLLFVKSSAWCADYRIAALVGFLVALSGQAIRAVTIGLDYIKRGGLNRQVYADRLVTGGIFAHCRNPLYDGNLLVMLGVGLAANSVLFLCVGAPFFLFAYLAIVAAEENFLRGKFGAEFDDYCRRVNRFWPRFTGLPATLTSMTFNWRRLISAEYGSTFSWMTAAIAVTLKNVWQAGDYSPHNPLVLGLWALFLIVLSAYLVARVLKKKGLLHGPA